MKKNAKIYLPGHTGLVGSALVRKLKEQGYNNLLLRTHAELDLRRQKEVEAFFEKERPEYVFLAAARVGGIQANISFPAEFIYENCAIQNNVIHAAYKQGVKKLIFLGSGCMYPRNCFQPMKEEYLLSGYLEPTNEAYGVAKLAGLKMCEAYNRQYKTNFICAILSNVYGPGDHFEDVRSHVVPALLKKFHEAVLKRLPSLTVWGTGKARRDFIFVDDAAQACLFLMEEYNGNDAVNIGYGQDIEIKDLVLSIQRTAGFKGKIVFDSSKPDGIPRKLLDISKIKKLGWKPKTGFEEGIACTYAWYRKHASKGIDLAVAG